MRVGDPITYAESFEIVRGQVVASRAFDDKAGSFAVGEVLRLLAGKTFDAAVYAVSTVQEEVGLRGARTSAYGIDPKVGVAVDVCHATDHPDMDRRRVGDIKLGGGPAIARGPNISPVVERMLIEAAEAEGIPYQLEAAPGGTGTDANAIQLTRAGVATGLVSIPLRYMHTAAEVISLEDLANVSRLLAAFILRVKDDTDFTVTPVKAVLDRIRTLTGFRETRQDCLAPTSTSPVRSQPMPGMIVAPEPLAVEAGAQVLMRGGNAIDAAVTCAFVEGIVNPMNCGIGGYMLATLHLADASGGTGTVVGL